MNWLPILTIDQLNEIDTLSYSKTVLIFKHSTRCSISDIAWRRLSNESASRIFEEHQVACYFLDLITYRDLSNKIADKYKVYHESPQILLIKDNDCCFDSSHLDISIEEIENQLKSPSPAY